MCKNGRFPDVPNVGWMLCILYGYLRGYGVSNYGRAVEFEYGDSAVYFSVRGHEFKVTVEEL